MARGGPQTTLTRGERWNTPTRPLLPVIQPDTADRRGGCACGTDSGLERVMGLAATPSCPAGLEPGEDQNLSGFRQLLERDVDRRTAIGTIGAGLLAAARPRPDRVQSAGAGGGSRAGGPRLAGVLPGQLPLDDGGGEDGDHRPPRAAPRAAAAAQDATSSSTGAQPGVLFGYAFNISKCKGYLDCVEACINENNLDRQRRHPVHPHLRDEEGADRLRRRRRDLPARGAGGGPLLHGHAVLPVRRTRRA